MLLPPRSASRRSFSRPPSRPDLDDEQLLVDSTTGIITVPSSPGMADTSEPYHDQPVTTVPVLPPLNLSTAIAYNSARAKVIPQLLFSQAYPSQPQPQPPRAHKSSFSVPPSSRAVNTFSVVDTTHGSDHGDSLHARAANYETLLRQFSLRRAPTASYYQRPSTSTTNTTGGVSRPRRSSRALLQRTSSAEERRFTLTRLGSSFTLDRIRRRSNEASSIATQVQDAAATTSSGGDPSATALSSSLVQDTSGSPSAAGTTTTRPASHRVSLARSLRRVRHRVAWTLGRMLREPLLPHSTAALVRQWLVLALLAVQCLYLPFAPSFLAPMRDSNATIHAMVRFNCALEIAWLLDVLLHFNTAIEVAQRAMPSQQQHQHQHQQHHQQITTDRTQIAASYLRGAFLLDALSALPLETVACWTRSSSSSSTSLIHTHPGIFYTGWALRMLTFRRVASCGHAIQRSRLGKWLTHVQYRQRHVLVLKVATELLVLAIVALHYLACAWHAMLLASAGSAGSGSATTVVATGDLWTSYTVAVVEVGQLLLPSGGSGAGTTTSAMLAGTATEGTDLHVYVATLIVMLLGVLLLAMASARLTVAFLLDTLLHHERDGTFQLAKTMAALDAQMTKVRLPRAIQDRVRQYYTLVASEYGGKSVQMMAGSAGNPAALGSLSAPLALEIALWKYTATLGRLPLWHDCSADLLSALVVRVVPRVYLKDDFVRRKGEIATELLVVQRGTCEFMAAMAISPKSSPQVAAAALPRLLATGGSLGALALLVDYKSPVYVRATSRHVEVAAVPRDVFAQLLNRFVEDRERLVRRILRAALETGEHAALWHVVHSVQSTARAMAGTASTTGSCSGSARTMAHLSGSVPPSRMPIAGGRVSTREAAKILLRVLGIYALPHSKALRLPLSLDPEALLRSDHHHHRQQPSQSSQSQPQSLHQQRPSSRALSISTRAATAATAAAQPLATTRSTASLAPVTPADPSHAPASTQRAMPSTTTTTITTNTTDPPDLLPDSRVLLDELAQTQTALLHLVQNLTDAVTRLDSKVSRMEERVHHRADDSARYHHHGLLRRRGSFQDHGTSGSGTAGYGTATGTGRSTGRGGGNVQPRRRSSYAVGSEIGHRDHGDDDGHSGRSHRSNSYDWLFSHAPRLLSPEEIAVLRAASGLLRPTTTHRSGGVGGAGSGGGGGGGGGGGADSRPASSSPASKSSRVSEIPAVSTFDDDGGDVYNDTAALTARGVDVRGQQLTSRSTPPLSSHMISTSTRTSIAQMTSRSPQLFSPHMIPKRARSLSTNTRRRLALVQQALGGGGGHGGQSGGYTTSTTTATNSSGSESSIRLTAVPVDVKRRASLSTMMWTRTKTSANTTTN